MSLNIAHKIYGIALVVLALMTAVAIGSIKLTSDISDELDMVASQQLPLSDTIGELNVRILEQSVLLERLFALPDESPEAVKRLGELEADINRLFLKAYALFELEEKDAHAPPQIFELHKSLNKVEADYRDYEKKGHEMLALHAADDNVTFEALLPDFTRLQSSVDEEVSALRRFVESATDGAVKRADEDEKFLLWYNISLTAISAVVGLGFAAVVTLMLVRNVRSLVRGAEAVGDGNLDIEVPVATTDEVGRLTASFNGMVEDLRMKERIKDTFGKYMDPRLVTRLIDNPELTQLGGERHEMTVMFIDLQGYTTISEKLAPADLVRMLNMFLGHMTDAVSSHKGVINDFLGDAVMAYWGPPFTGANEHAVLAGEAAVAATQNFETYKAEVAAELGAEVDGLDIAMRIGISTGNVISGNIGSSATRKFSVIGDPVNLGARLEGANKNYGTRIMLSERTQELIGDALQVRELDRIRVKGKTEPTRVYELISSASPAGDIEAALTAYRRQDWGAARAAFTGAGVLVEGDPVPPVFLERIAYFEENPPGPDWDGVWELKTK